MKAFSYSKFQVPDFRLNMEHGTWNMEYGTWNFIRILKITHNIVENWTYYEYNQT